MGALRARYGISRRLLRRDLGVDGVEIDPGQNDILILAVAVAIDIMANPDKKKEKKKKEKKDKE